MRFTPNVCGNILCQMTKTMYFTIMDPFTETVVHCAYLQEQRMVVLIWE